MRHRLALILTVVGAIALPVVMAATVLYASDAAIGDSQPPLSPQFGTTQQSTTGTATTNEDRPKHRKHDDKGGTTTGGDDHGGSTSGGNGTSGSGSGSGDSSGSGSGSSGSGSSGSGSDDGSSHGGDSGSGHGGDD